MENEKEKIERIKILLKDINATGIYSMSRGHYLLLETFENGNGIVTLCHATEKPIIFCGPWKIERILFFIERLFDALYDATSLIIN